MNMKIRNEPSLVLVVDDDATVRFLAKQFLEKAGFTIHTAENGKQALSKIKEKAPDIVLLDVVMPEMDGFTTCIELRKLPVGKNIPVLMVTGLDDFESIHRTYEAGATDFTTKPINWLILEHRIRYLLRAASAMGNLRRSEEKNRALLNAIPDMMIRLTKDGTVLELKRSKPFDQLMIAGEFQHKTVSEVLPKDFSVQLIHHTKQSLRTGRTQIFEHRLQMNGKPLDVENRIVISGKDEVLVLVRDDTLRKSAEEELRKAHEELEQRVEERTDELKKANIKLQEEIHQREQVEDDLRKAYIDLQYTQTQLVQSAKLASIGELAAGVVHELNQPLMVIRGYAQTLLKNPVAGEEQINGLRRIEKNTGRMTNIINHLRAFSRQSESDLKPIQINKIIEDAFLMMGEQLRLRNIDLVKNLGHDLPMVRGDANKLEQVLLNLMTNAKDAIEQRREQETALETAETVTYSKSPDMLEITTRFAENEKGQVEILIKDNGCGIPNEMSDKIFDPFFTTKEVGKGTGLGLSISYGIIKEHQAEIEIADSGPNGTTFRLLLPVYSEAS